MSTDYTVTIDSHPNIYNASHRKLKIYYSIPEKGINNNTGILLFIPGFGGNANSNVYKKMRSLFSNKYNVVTVQCDFFGWEFMQHEVLNESLDNFNDMGLMQALDNITATIVISEIIKENNLKFNAGKIIVYGHSHGAYLAYLCNRFAPNLFSIIIDNSAWLFPNYLKTIRALTINNNRLVFDYYAKSIIKDIEILDLPTLYNGFYNNTAIHSFHGDCDNLISLEKKRSFCQEVYNCFLYEITKEQVDYKIFNANTHGLKADFILLFDKVYKKTSNKFISKYPISIENHTIKTNLFKYEFNYDKTVPILSIIPNPN